MRSVVAGSTLGAMSSRFFLPSITSAKSASSSAFGIPYSTFSESLLKSHDGLCTPDDYDISCIDGKSSYRLLTTTSDDQPIFRISLEGMSDKDPDDVRPKALALGPSDAEKVPSDAWEDGSIYELYTSPWLASQFTDDASRWAGNDPGTFALVLQHKFGQNKMARAILSLPMSQTLITDSDHQVKGGNRAGTFYYVTVDTNSSLEGRVLSIERTLYNNKAKNKDDKWSCVFAYSPDANIGVDPANVGRGAASTDGKGWDGEGTFLIMDDKDGTAQISVVTDEMLNDNSYYVSK